jgi:hypothetical protein
LLFPRAYLHKNVKYDALWQINLINGFLIVCPKLECGAMMYANEKKGNIMPARERKGVNNACVGWENYSPVEGFEVN